jgi:hypothetical protein
MLQVESEVGGKSAQLYRCITHPHKGGKHFENKGNGKFVTLLANSSVESELQS